ncbi:WAS/WASL-interacting protein family member 2 isoform 1-T2 [Mantella aurantiaca]
MPIPPPPPPPPGPPPPPTFSQANIEPPKLNRDEQRGRGALLNDICKGARLKKTTVVNDRSAPVLEKAKGAGGSSGFGPSSGGALQPKGGLFQGGVPKLRPVGTKDSPEGPSGRSPLQGSAVRSAAPRPPVSGGRPQDDSDSGSNRSSPPDVGRAHRPSLPDLTRPPSTTSPGMKHSSSAPPPPPGRRQTGPAPPPPQDAKPYNRDKPLPPTPGHRAPAAPPVKPPPSPVNMRAPSSQGQPPPPPYRQPPASVNGPPSPINDQAPQLPQRHNSLHRKQAPVRNLAPPPPPSANLSPGGNRPPPPNRDPPGRGPAPPPPPPVIRNGGRDPPPPPPPPYRMHGGSDASQNRVKPPPPPSRTPSGPPPPPPPVRNGHRESISVGRSFADDFESKYSFHSVDEFPAPEDYRPFQKVYPSKIIRATRGAPPLPPIPR